MDKDECVCIDMTYALIALGDELYEHTDWGWEKVIGIFVRPEKFFIELMKHTLEKIRLLKQAVTDVAIVEIGPDGNLVRKEY